MAEREREPGQEGPVPEAEGSDPWDGFGTRPSLLSRGLFIRGRDYTTALLITADPLTRRRLYGDSSSTGTRCRCAFFVSETRPVFSFCVHKRKKGDSLKLL